MGTILLYSFNTTRQSLYTRTHYFMQALLLASIQTEEDYKKSIIAAMQLQHAYLSLEEYQNIWLQIEIYERTNWVFEGMSPVEAIQFRMKQFGLKQKDLVQIIGSKSRVSEIMHGRRKLSLEQIRRVYQHLHIPLQVLIKEYKTTDES